MTFHIWCAIWISVFSPIQLLRLKSEFPFRRKVPQRTWEWVLSVVRLTTVLSIVFDVLRRMSCNSSSLYFRYVSCRNLFFSLLHFRDLLFSTFSFPSFSCCFKVTLLIHFFLVFFFSLSYAFLFFLSFYMYVSLTPFLLQLRASVTHHRQYEIQWSDLIRQVLVHLSAAITHLWIVKAHKKSLRKFYHSRWKELSTKKSCLESHSI